jgi:hypothetical protein
MTFGVLDGADSGVPADPEAPFRQPRPEGLETTVAAVTAREGTTPAPALAAAMGLTRGPSRAAAAARKVDDHSDF